MRNSMKHICSIMVVLSLYSYAGFTRLNQPLGVVKDTTTGLQWQDEYSDNNGEVKRASWEGAINYCEALTLGGEEAWRLPNINELLSIVDYSRTDPAMNPIFNTYGNRVLPDWLDDGYWSSSTTHLGKSNSSYNRSYGWAVYFRLGVTNFYGFESEIYFNDYKDDAKCVRCVR